MEILLLSDRLDGGGVETVLQSVSADLIRAGHRVTLWTPEGTRQELREHYLPALRYRRYPFWKKDAKPYTLSWLFQRACRVLLEQGLFRLKKWDRVVAMKEAQSMRIAARLRADKKLGWIHTDFTTLHWTKYFFRSDAEELQCMQGFDRLACVSDAARRSVIQTLGDPGNLCVRYNPIDAAAIREKAKARPADAVPTGGKPLLVAVGRLDKGKRFDLLIELCRELQAEVPHELWIVGGGEEEEALKQQCASLAFVRLLGQKENPYPYIAAADLLVSASESESYGLTVQEALILGVPVLACACPAIAENLDERFGKLTGFSRQELREGLRALLTRPELAAQYRENIRQSYDCSLLWQPRLDAIRSLIEE